MISLISVGAPILEDACIADVFAVTVNFLFFNFIYQLSYNMKFLDWNILGLDKIVYKGYWALMIHAFPAESWFTFWIGKFCFNIIFKKTALCYSWYQFHQYFTRFFVGSAFHSFSLLTVWHCNFFGKEYCAKGGHKMLVKLTTDLLNRWQYYS